MDTHPMLQERITAAQELLGRVDAMCQRQPQQPVEGRAKLSSRLRAELKFLTKVRSGAMQVKESHLHSTNLTHLRAIVEAAESLEGVVSLLHVFAYDDDDEDGGGGGGGGKQSLVVDVVANGGHTWVKAVGRKAEALHNIWQGRGQYGNRSIVSQAEEYVRASEQQPIQYSKPHVVFAFYNGVSSPMADRLRAMGVSVRGDIVAVNAEEEEEDEEDEEESSEEEAEEEGEGQDGEQLGAEKDLAQAASEPNEEEEGDEEDYEEEEEEEELSQTRVDRATVVASLAFPTQVKVDACPRANLDITTLISYVSSLSHGHCHFTFREQVLTEQAAQERQHQVLPRLEAFMVGKELYACRSAVDDFQVILDTLGGPGEKTRAQELLARVRVVPDQPSERTQRLTVSGKVNARSLMIFGTGDSLRAVTMTANSGFVRAAANQGVRYSVFVHQPRALTEGKEWRATPI
ncbi:hypothetical protein CRUP_025947 [Coryphaenoides rupestris]|nr:hypothetical protein CRUP_025947 [Coryphaenoides rupestris]